MRRITGVVLAIALAGSTAAPAIAQMSMDGGWNLSIGAGNYLLSNIVLNSAVKSSQNPRPAPRPAAPKGATADAPQVKLADIRFVRKGGFAGSVSTIAGAFPAAQQTEARQVYGQLLAAYPQVVRQLGGSENDLASAVAAFIAGNYSGYHNIPFPDDKFRPLVEQMRRSMEADPQIARLTNAQKQQNNDVLAAIGMQMAVLQGQLQQKPDPKLALRMRQAAGDHLRTTLGIDPTRVRFTANGMVM